MFRCSWLSFFSVRIEAIVSLWRQNKVSVQHWFWLSFTEVPPSFVKEKNGWLETVTILAWPILDFEANTKIWGKSENNTSPSNYNQYLQNCYEDLYEDDMTISRLLCNTAASVNIYTIIKISGIIIAISRFTEVQYIRRSEHILNFTSHAI